MSISVPVVPLGTHGSPEKIYECSSPTVASVIMSVKFQCVVVVVGYECILLSTPVLDQLALE
jgi:hypothetical protein